MTFDVARVRRSFPALTEGAAHFDGPGGSQVPVEVADAVAAAMRSAVSNRGSVTAAERRAEAIVVDARQALADLVGGSPGGVVFGRSMTQLTYDFTRALSKQWTAGDEVVVTRLDHDANIRPWVQAAASVGAVVRWADFDSSTGELAVDSIAARLSDRTRVVAVTAASNLIGTRPDVAAVADVVHSAGALLYVDGVHLVPHAPVDVTALGADFFACSPYKFFGPHLGAVVADPVQLASLQPDKLLPSTDAVPERFELGTLPYELLAGVRACVDFIADLVPGGGDRRQRVLASMSAVEEHEAALFAVLLEGLASVESVTLHAGPVRRTPTALFSVRGRSPREMHERLAEHGVNAPGSHFYALEASRHLGLGDTGAVRAGLAPYTDRSDVERLVTAVGACR